VRQRLLVSGRVQGVFFRASTREFARSQGATGWVRNLPNGRVEICVEGTPEQVAAVREWAATDPRFADVERVEVIDEDETQEFSDFSVR